jgi:hypothetical protein
MVIKGAESMSQVHAQDRPTTAPDPTVVPPSDLATAITLLAKSIEMLAASNYGLKTAIDKIIEHEQGGRS